MELFSIRIQRTFQLVSTVIWDKNRLVSIMLKFYRTAIIAKSFLGDGTYIQIKEIPEHSWQENIEGNFI